MFTVVRLDERLYAIVKKKVISSDDTIKKLPFEVFGILKVEGTCYRNCSVKRQNICTKIPEQEVENFIEITKRKAFIYDT